VQASLLPSPYILGVLLAKRSRDVFFGGSREVKLAHGRPTARMIDLVQKQLSSSLIHALGSVEVLLQVEDIQVSLDPLPNSVLVLLLHLLATVVALLHQVVAALLASSEKPLHLDDVLGVRLYLVQFLHLFLGDDVGQVLVRAEVVDLLNDFHLQVVLFHFDIAGLALGFFELSLDHLVNSDG